MGVPITTMMAVVTSVVTRLSQSASRTSGSSSVARSEPRSARMKSDSTGRVMYTTTSAKKRMTRRAVMLIRIFFPAIFLMTPSLILLCRRQEVAARQDGLAGRRYDEVDEGFRQRLLRRAGGHADRVRSDHVQAVRDGDRLHAVLVLLLHVRRVYD